MSTSSARSSASSRRISSSIRYRRSAKTGGHVAALHASLRLLDYARSRHITTVCTSLVAEGGVVRDDDDTDLHDRRHLAAPAYLVHGGERNRTLTIVKSRGMKHSNQVRELLLSDSGITLADVYTAGGTVLVGTARWEHEASERDAAARRRADYNRHRVAAERTESRLRAQLQALSAELDAHRAEAALISNEDTDAQREYDWLQAEMRRLRRADADTRAPGEERRARPRTPTPG